MQNEKTQTTKNHFALFLDAIPFGQYKQVRADILTRTGVSRTTFSNWYKTGVAKEHYREIIEQVSAQHLLGKIWK